MTIRWKHALCLGLLALATACAVGRGGGGIKQHRWWSRLGPVIPHESFPADCKLCHVGNNWQELVEDFEFDHKRLTGVALEGAHSAAQCLRCHNDRGPVEVFTERGCQGCHEDVHLARLGSSCIDCHTQVTWRPFGQVERHNRTRFPLDGVHAETDCRRCHVGAPVGIFRPVDSACVTCHRSDLLRAVNPNHIGLGLIDNCQRCHKPTVWEQAFTD